MKQSEIINLGTEISSNAEIAIENTEFMNSKFELSFMLLTMPILMATLLLNLSVIVVIWKKEKTIVNQLMTMECIVNISYSSLATFQISPYYRGLELEAYCYPHLMLSITFVIFNRLLPVAIVVYR